MRDIKTGEPYINIWFGNFYRPAYDGEEFIDGAVRLLKELGFNSVMLDSKAWEDFAERYNGGEASVYVRTQEYMQKRILENDMSYVQLALYLNADNLYPNIRFSPPIYGESVTNPDGTDGKWYKYWSDKAKKSMTEHVKGLYKLYGDGFTRCETKAGKTAEMMCTMWDPIVAPSFDLEGKARYIEWLKRKYGRVDKLNSVYGTAYKSFDELQMEDLWFTCVYDRPTYTKAELDSGDTAAVMWADNMMWKRDEICAYFKDMQMRLKEVSPSIFTCPDMAQWSYFLNIDASALVNVGFSNLWDTANRGIDIYKAAKYVDCAHFITVPITPYGDPDAYVVSCQHSMMRMMNKEREFIGGIYWGRFLYSDIYEFLTPCEIIGSMVAAGIDGYASYGMCGLDDGGVMHRMPDSFNSSLRLGNEWAKKVIPKIKGRRRKQIAILFPSAMALLEPMSVSGNKERRCDLLGWYKMCCDLGCCADVIDLDMVAEGILDGYAALIIPENDCYMFDVNTGAECEIKRWVNGGGIVLSSPADMLCKNVFGISGTQFSGEPIWYGEGGMPQGDRFEYFDDGECIAKYCANAEAEPKETDKNAVVMHRFGKGRVYSFGFAYGYSYCAKIAPHVPLSQKNNELYPIPMMKRNIAEDILTECGAERNEIYGRNIETAVFDNCMIIVNHRSQPVEIETDGEKLFQYNVNGHTLMPRSAVYVQIKQ